jgi:Ran GTPase-activating protein (RanGAP) involved in mRNA processing and transport
VAQHFVDPHFPALSPQSRILSALAHGTSLEVVHLNALRIDSACAPSLVAMALPLKRLRVLSLEGNRLTEPGLLALAAGLAGHPSLSELNLADQHTPISLKAVESLIGMMEQVKNIERGEIILG